MEFEDLQKSWKAQPVIEIEDISAVQERVVSQWSKQRRKILRSNIGTTIAFSVTFCIMGWVYVTFREGRSLFFGGSLLSVNLLMLVYLFVIWKGVSVKKTDPSVPLSSYLGNYLRQLKWRREVITTYSWVYTVILWLSMMFYEFDVDKGGGILHQVTVPALTTLYIFGMRLWIRNTREKKQLKTLDDLTKDINLIKNSLES